MNITILFNVNVGNLNELKIKKIREIFSDFPTGVSIENQVTMISQNTQVIINSSRIQYTFVDENIEKATQSLKKLQESLMLDEKFENGLIMLTNVKDIKEDAFEYTKNKFKPLPLVSESIGIGVREFFKYRDLICELKVEPFLQNKNSLFIEARYNLNEILISTLRNVLNDIKDDYNTKELEIFKKLNLE